MPGSFVGIKKNSSSDQQTWPEDAFHDLLFEQDFSLRFIHRSPQFTLANIAYEGYPSETWETDDYIIFVEGLIYNVSKSSIHEQLSDIARCIAEGQPYQQLIRSFVKVSDGDYLVYVWDKKDQKLIIFNDRFARLPFFYFQTENVFLGARDLKGLFPFMPSISFNRMAMLDFLIFEFVLGTETIFQHILRLAPAQLLTISLEPQWMFERADLITLDFTLIEPFRDKKQSIEILKRLFMESTQKRLCTLKDEGFQITSDLSGGMDSRTIMGALSFFDQNVRYVCLELATGNEIPFAHRAFVALGKPGTFLPMEIDHEINYAQMKRVAFWTNAMTNATVAVHAYSDSAARKKALDGKTARFMGFGGNDFIRQYSVLPIPSLPYGVFRGILSSSLDLSGLCRMMQIEPSCYKRRVNEYIQHYPEKDLQSKIRHWHFDYQSHLVNAGEDRHRIHCWTVQPFWGLDFMTAVLFTFPVSWSSNSYFVSFMRSIHPNLLRSPFYGIKEDLSHPFNAWLRDWETRVSTYLKILLTSNDFLYQQVRKFARRPVLNDKQSEFYRQFKQSYDEGKVAQGLFSFQDLDSSMFKYRDIYSLSRPLTLLMLFNELERRYPDKIKI